MYGGKINIWQINKMDNYWRHWLVKRHLSIINFVLPFWNTFSTWDKVSQSLPFQLYLPLSLLFLNQEVLIPSHQAFVLCQLSYKTSLVLPVCLLWLPLSAALTIICNVLVHTYLFVPTKMLASWALESGAEFPAHEKLLEFNLCFLNKHVDWWTNVWLIKCICEWKDDREEE